MVRSAAPKKPAKPRPTEAPPGGIARSPVEVARLVDVCEEAVLLGMSLWATRMLMGRALELKDEHGKLAPMSRRTTQKYIARVRQRHDENPLPGLEEARTQAVRRANRMIQRLTGDGSIKNAAEIRSWEERLAKIYGLDAPRDQEAIAAQAQAIVDRLIEKARQERAAKQAQLDHEEDERQRRMIEVGEVPAVPSEPDLTPG